MRARRAWQTSAMSPRSRSPSAGHLRLAALRVPLAALLVLLAVAAMVQRATYLVALERTVAALHDAASHRLDAAAAELAAPMARFEYLPALLETTPAVMQLLASPDDAALRADANRALTRINAVAGANMVFVLAPSGLALAAADWTHPDSPVGHVYDYRPYVRDALASGRGRFFGVGATSRKSGYYLSYALKGTQGTIGVAAVKIDLDPAEQAWSTQPGEVVVTDARGVAILSTRADWKFRGMRALGDAERAEVAAERSYAPDVAPLPWEWIDTARGSGRRLRIDAREHLLTTRPLAAFGWEMHAVDALEPAQASARTTAWIASLSASVALLLAMAAWQSRRAAMHKLAAQAALQAAHDTLERRVAERTAQLTELNASLAAEVESRKAVERNLQETQHELVHAAKMAVLGQLSAGLAHELNQPLAALRTLSDNAIVLMEKNRLDETRANVERISQMVGRLGELTRRLKSFAHKPGEEAVATPLAAALGNAQALLAERMRRQKVSCSIDVSPPGLAALAEPSLLEQILVNLFANAIDAMASREDRRLDVRARRSGERIEIEVADTGAGISEEMLPRLFEPFATSKPRGAGLGLGLMISQRIALDFGGRIRACNRPGGGATFTVELPAAETVGVT